MTFEEKVYNFLDNLKPGKSARIINDKQRDAIAKYMSERPFSGNLSINKELTKVKKYKLIYPDDFKKDLFGQHRANKVQKCSDIKKENKIRSND